MREVSSQMFARLHVKYPLLLSDFNETLIHGKDFREILKLSNFMKVRTVDLFHADGQTGMTEVNVVFRNFKNVPQNEWYHQSTQL